MRTQSIAVVGFAAAALFLGDELLALVALASAVGPYLVLQSRRRDRTAQIEKQIDGWLLALANALKATPSLGEALASSVTLTQAPLSEEIETTLKELALGSPMDEALMALAGRVDSPTLWGAVATLQVSRNTGGDVPRILEETASTLREMERLEAVVRTKTADGRSQAQVLAFMPFFVVAAIHFMDPNWLTPLTENATGILIIAASTALWLAGFIVARKVLNVDV
ncbi:MAG: type II secretion system F family protein, partial [Deltaproteobacteria bacterium]|nr:type II secretion system F family protein [Deltaproteobacteria bacterium]